MRKKKKSPSNKHAGNKRTARAVERKPEGNWTIKPFLPYVTLLPPPPPVAYGRGGEALGVTPVSASVSQPTSQLVYVYVHVAASWSGGGWGGEAMRSGCWPPQPQVQPRRCSRPLTALTAIHLAPERGPGDLSRQKFPAKKN